MFEWGLGSQAVVLELKIVHACLSVVVPFLFLSGNGAMLILSCGW